MHGLIFKLWFDHPTLKYPAGHPKAGQAKRFRLDSYSPPSGTNPGKIVSRKATTFSEIQQSTFEKYLVELKEKYGVAGTVADRANVGTFTGELILEVPKVNETFAKRILYEQLAEQKGIKILYKLE
jgi:hypothetical protein